MSYPQRNRPNAANVGAGMSLAGDLHSVPKQADYLADLDALAESLSGRFAVQVTLDGDRRRTYIYRSAAAAERAVQRATERGQRAHVTLVQFLPVGVVTNLGGAR